MSTGLQITTKKNKLKRHLPIQLTDRELLSKSKELAEANHSLGAFDVKKKDINASLKSEEANIQSTISTLSNTVKTGEEYREIPCDEISNWERGVRQLVRTDTGEIIDEEVILDGERQLHIDSLDEEAPTCVPEDEDSEE